MCFIFIKICLKWLEYVNFVANHGTWRSDNRIVFHLDPETGIGFAADVGSSTAVHTISNDVTTSTDVTVVPICSVIFNPLLSNPYLTNAHPDEETHFPVFLYSSVNYPSASSLVPNVHGKHATFLLRHVFLYDVLLMFFLGKNCNFTDKFRRPLPFHCMLKLSNDSFMNPLEHIFEVKEAFNINLG